MSIEIRKKVSLAEFTTFKIGGPANYFVEISGQNQDDILEALEFARKKKLEIFILGGGSNVLVSDGGFPGLVIRLYGGEIRQEKNNPERVVCHAGVNLASLNSFCFKNSLAGLSWATGIPGTVGGAIRGNAGAFGGEMKDCVEFVNVLDFSSEEKPRFKNFSREECLFDYRSSLFKKRSDLLVLEAGFLFENGSREVIGEDMKEILRKRREKQPQDFPSAGSFFQNPVVKNKKIIELFEKDSGMICRGGKIPAGWLVESAGFRGRKIGRAQVSEKHSNFVVNLGGAGAEDVVVLASMIKQKVREKFNIQLKEEVRYVGF